MQDVTDEAILGAITLLNGIRFQRGMFFAVIGNLMVSLGIEEITYLASDFEWLQENFGVGVEVTDDSICVKLRRVENDKR